MAPLLGRAGARSPSPTGWRCARQAGPARGLAGAQSRARVEKLGVAPRAARSSPPAPKTAGRSAARDKALEAEAASIENVERLVRYHRDLARLCPNFVSFEDFYDGGSPAMFQAGTLYLDQRACKLCLPVDDAAKHATMAGLAGAYLAYLDCVRKATGEKMQIVAAFTAGERDNLMVGRNGVFYDRQGRDWDATITKIVDNPISIRQAFWAPYKKFVRLIEEQVAKRAAAADARVAHKLATRPRRPPTSTSPSRPSRRRWTSARWRRSAWPSGAIGTFVTALVGYATGLFKLGALATAGAVVGDHAAHLAALGGAGVHQAAQAKPGPDPRRQRLGGERAGPDQRAVRRHPAAAWRSCRAARKRDTDRSRRRPRLPRRPSSSWSWSGMSATAGTTVNSIGCYPSTCG